MKIQLTGGLETLKSVALHSKSNKVVQCTTENGRKFFASKSKHFEVNKSGNYEPKFVNDKNQIVWEVRNNWVVDPDANSQLEFD